MPQVGAFIAAIILPATATATTTAIVAGIINTALGAVLNFAIAKINAPDGPRPQEVTIENRSSNAKRIRHMGRVRTGGTVAFWDWNNVAFTRRLFKLLLVSDGGISGVIRWYLNGEPVNVDANGYVTTEPWNKGNVRLRFRSGIAGQPDYDGGLWSDLQSAFPGYWTTDHRLRGIGTVLATFDDVDTDEIAEVYSGGEPEVNVLIDGVPCYWIPAGDYANTRNPARQLSHVLANPVDGILADDSVNAGAIAAARTACLEEVGRSEASGGGTRPRYESGVSYNLSDPLKDTAQRLLDAMGGWAWIGSDGRLVIKAGVWEEPTFTLTKDHILEADFGSGTNQMDRTTTLVPSFVSPLVNWQETTADSVVDTNAILRWGEGQPKGVDLLGVQDHGQARHIAKQRLARMNPHRTLTIRTGPGIGLRLFDEKLIAVNLPYRNLNNTPFWVERIQFDATSCTVELAQAAPGSFTDTPSDDGTPPAQAEVIDRTERTFSTEITSLVVVPNGGAPYIRVNGTFAASWGYTAYAQVRRNTETEWTNMIRETSGTGQYRFRSSTLEDGGVYVVRSFVAPASGQTWKMASTPVVVTDIDVIVDNTAPANPVVTSQSGSAGGTMIATFEPDLGINYWRTGLYRAGPTDSFADATFIKWNYSTAAEVTISAPVPAGGARFWLRSQNRSQVNSGAVLVGTYT